jgi:FkbM family methyltransferase
VPRSHVVIAILVLVASSAMVIAQRLGVVNRFEENERCCHLPLWRNLVVTADESLGLAEYPAEIDQDKWVLEKVFPGVTDGFFVDVGSGHGTIGSNSVALERRGWKGVCVDPFPVRMQGRSCQMFREVVFSRPGLAMPFHTAGGLGGIGTTLGRWNGKAARAPVVTLTTVTLDDLLARAGAPPFIHFVSLDIEGAELEALRAFPFERHRVGAWRSSTIAKSPSAA